jgi:hypothetical protein
VEKVKKHRLAPGSSGQIRLLLYKDTWGALRADCEKRGVREYSDGLPDLGLFELSYNGPDIDAQGSLSARVRPPLADGEFISVMSIPLSGIPQPHFEYRPAVPEVVTKPALGTSCTCRRAPFIERAIRATKRAGEHGDATQWRRP